MHKLVTGCILPLLLASLAASAAVTVMECVDVAGNASFRDKCPPDMTKKSDKKLAVPTKKGLSSADVAQANPVVLYSVPGCDACDLVRNVLATRNIPFAEKGVQENAANQDEMKTKTGGLTVPAVTVGTAVITGYSRAGLDAALNQAGYPPSAGATGTVAPPPGAAK